jgi:hypothetical protein
LPLFLFPWESQSLLFCFIFFISNTYDLGALMGEAFFLKFPLVGFRFPALYFFQSYYPFLDVRLCFLLIFGYHILFCKCHINELIFSTLALTELVSFYLRVRYHVNFCSKIWFASLHFADGRRLSGFFYSFPFCPNRVRMSCKYYSYHLHC